MFYQPDAIEKQLVWVFAQIHENALLKETNPQKQIKNLSWVMAEPNIVHPFREGNGRSICELIRSRALEYELRINWGNTDRETHDQCSNCGSR